MPRRSYSDEFKAEAVQLVTVQGLSPSQAAGQVGVDENVLNRWVAKDAVGSRADLRTIGASTQADNQMQGQETTQGPAQPLPETASMRAELSRLWDLVHRLVGLKTQS
jgi:transposase-like protein